jgi:undecaprenyl diphosphate synthase
MSVAEALPHHTAIILDGNGRWASSRGPAASRRDTAPGASAVRRTVEAACEIGLPVLTLLRLLVRTTGAGPPPRSFGLFGLLREYLESETRRLRKHGVRLNRDRPARPARPAIVEAIEAAERATAGGTKAGSAPRDRLLGPRGDRPRGASPLAAEARHPPRSSRTSSEGPRWTSSSAPAGSGASPTSCSGECAYAELAFLDVPWPEFARGDLESAIADFAGRSRRFGGIGTSVGEKGV